ncbi:MAG: hypothetical protein M3Z56_07175 [Bacteroidota bacterium]|nr:hypothetical protein [Bacteroidota bacterium]
MNHSFIHKKCVRENKCHNDFKSKEKTREKKLKRQHKRLCEIILGNIAGSIHQLE